MNEIIKNIMTRQTIREYTSEQVPMELLNVVLDAAIRAPSGRNTQPCHLRVLRSKEKLDEMNRDFKNIVGWDTPAYTGWDIRPVYHNAPTFIFIFAAAWGSAQLCFIAFPYISPKVHFAFYLAYMAVPWIGLAALIPTFRLKTR